MHALVIPLLFIGTSVLFITTPASHRPSPSIFIFRCVWHRYQYCLDDTEFNFTSLLFCFFLPLYVNVNEWIKEGSRRKKRERARKRHQPQPRSCTSVAQSIYKLNQRLVSQTALEGSHCDCGNDWDLINSLCRLCKVHICLFRNRLLRINQLSNRKGNRMVTTESCRQYVKCVLLSNAPFITRVPTFLFSLWCCGLSHGHEAVNALWLWRYHNDMIISHNYLMMHLRILTCTLNGCPCFLKCMEIHSCSLKKINVILYLYGPFLTTVAHSEHFTLLKCIHILPLEAK